MFRWQCVSCQVGLCKSTPCLLPSLVTWKDTWRAPSRSPIKKKKKKAQQQQTGNSHETQACSVYPWHLCLLSPATQLWVMTAWSPIFLAGTCHHIGDIKSNGLGKDTWTLGLLSHISYKPRQWCSMAGQQHLGWHKITVLSHTELLNQNRTASFQHTWSSFFSRWLADGIPTRRAATATSTCIPPQCSISTTVKMSPPSDNNRQLLNMTIISSFLG